MNLQNQQYDAVYLKLPPQPLSEEQHSLAHDAVHVLVRRSWGVDYVQVEAEVAIQVERV